MKDINALSSVLATLSMIALSGCEKTHDVPVHIDYDGADTGSVSTHFLGIFSWGDCIDAASWITSTFPLEEIPSELVDDQVFTGDEGREIGELAPGTYTFVAFALNEDCDVEFQGCVTETIGNSWGVSIEMRPDDMGSPACVVCSNGLCSFSDDDDW